MSSYIWLHFLKQLKFVPMLHPLTHLYIGCCYVSSMLDALFCTTNNTHLLYDSSENAGNDGFHQRSILMSVTRQV